MKGGDGDYGLWDPPFLLVFIISTFYVWLSLSRFSLSLLSESQAQITHGSYSKPYILPLYLTDLGAEEAQRHKPLHTGKSISKSHLYILNSEFLGFQFFGVHCLPWLILLFSLNPKQPTCDPPEIWTHRLKQFKNDSRSESSARLKDPIFSDWVTSHAQTRPDPTRAYP